MVVLRQMKNAYLHFVDLLKVHKIAKFIESAGKYQKEQFLEIKQSL